MQKHDISWSQCPEQRGAEEPVLTLAGHSGHPWLPAPGCQGYLCPAPGQVPGGAANEPLRSLKNYPIKALSLLWVSAHILALSHLGIYFDSMRKRCCFAKVRVQLYCRDTAAAPCKYTISHHTHHHRSSPPALLHTQSQIDKEYSVICNVVCVCAVQVGVIIIVTVHK